MDVGWWLRNLGLDQYEANFRENKIDADVLPRLTADDLKDVDVSAVGDRRRLLDAIATLAGAIPTEASRRAPHSAPPKGPQYAAARRPITVMFCDLLGSNGAQRGWAASQRTNGVLSYSAFGLDQSSSSRRFLALSRAPCRPQHSPGWCVRSCRSPWR